MKLHRDKSYFLKEGGQTKITPEIRELAAQFQTQNIRLVFEILLIALVCVCTCGFHQPKLFLERAWMRGI